MRAAYLSIRTRPSAGAHCRVLTSKSRMGFSQSFAPGRTSRRDAMPSRDGRLVFNMQDEWNGNSVRVCPQLLLRTPTSTSTTGLNALRF